jgi:hypothetical protein
MSGTSLTERASSSCLGHLGRLEAFSEQWYIAIQAERRPDHKGEEYDHGILCAIG